MCRPTRTRNLYTPRPGMAGTPRRHRVSLEVVMQGAGRTLISQPPAQAVEQTSSAGVASQW
jgi:hypothetical protein